MILVKDNKLQAELLSSEGTLSSKTIKDYDYIEFKNDFEQIIDILSTNLLVHSLYQEYLKYEITEDLKFKILSNNDVYDCSFTSDIISYEDTSVLTLDRSAYDNSIELCTILLRRVKRSFDKLNEVEKFIIKSLEFDEPKLTDEELIERLMTYKNGYYLFKKSAFIKLGLQLNTKILKQKGDESLIKYKLDENGNKIFIRQ